VEKSGNPPAIEVSNLTKHFGEVLAVNNINFSVNKGELFGFLGPNGAGKTTTIRMLLGFLNPSCGSCRVLGGSPGRDVALRRRIGYLPGDLRVDPALTGAELFSWYGHLRGGVDGRRLDELLERLDLDPGRPFGALSKGNRQKVGLVQAFQNDPDVLILDEPTSGLDPLVQREFMRLLREATDRGAAVLFSSHILPAVERIASRIAIIRRGELVSVSTVEELLDRARRRLELRFADSVAPDIFDGVAGVVEVDVEGQIVQLTIDGAVGPALAAAVEKAELVRINNVGDDLEDLFVSLYDGEKKANGEDR
jgi:ABC-2 type transport system ATP-binding protein